MSNGLYTIIILMKIMKDKNLYLYIFLIGITTFLSATFKIYESDAFWHLKAGEYILKNLTIPTTDPFTINGDSKIWVNTYWLFEVIIYLIKLATGTVGLILFKALICSIAFVFFYMTIVTAGTGNFFAFFFFLPLLVIFRERFLVRPDIFSYLFLSIYMYILLLKKLKNKNLLYLLPIIMLFWTNLHSGAFFGLVVLFSFTAGDFFLTGYKELTEGRPLSDFFKNQRSIFLILLLTLMFFFLSPANYKSISYLISQTEVRKIYDISEFRPIIDAEYRHLLYIYCSISFVLIVSLRRIPFYLLLPTLIFIIPGGMTRRMFYYALLVSFPAVMLTLFGFLKFLQKVKIPQVLYVLAAIIWSVLILTKLFTDDPMHYTGFGIRNIYFPEGHVNFIKRYKLKVNIFNTLNIGGGIIFAGYPEIKAFVDTRIQVNETTLREINESIKSPDAFKAMLSKYNINAILVENNAGLISQNYLKMDEWALVYWDDYSMLLLKREGEFSDFIKEHEIKIINPETLVFDLPSYLHNEALVERVIYHLKRSIVINPNCYKAYYSLAYLMNYSEKKNYKEIYSYLNKAYKLEPRYLPTLYELANLFATLKDFPRALYFYKEFLHWGRFYPLLTSFYPTIYKEVGLVYLNLGDKRRAKKYLKKSLQVMPYDDFVKELLNNP